MNGYVKIMPICLGTMAIVGAGLTPAQSEASTRPVATAGEGGPHAARTLTLEIGDLVAHGLEIDASHFHVDVFDRRGALRFSGDLTLGDEHYATLMWTLHGDPAMTGSLRVRVDRTPSLGQLIMAALVIETNVSNATSGHSYDNWGCDDLLGIGLIDSCGDTGACCDIHDDCYARNRCSVSSWLPGVGSDACKQCNYTVVSCVMNSRPGPSICCSMDNCGEPR